MDTYVLKVYDLGEGWELRGAYNINAKSLQAAVNRLSRTLKVKFRNGLSWDGKTCFTLDDPPPAQPFYLHVYTRDRSPQAGALDLLYRHVQKEVLYATSEAYAMRQFRDYTLKRFKFTGLDDRLKANRYDCQSHAVFVFEENPEPDTP